MQYGLWLSAAGVMSNVHKQDVLANNLANAETVGFKRDVTTFQQRLTEAAERRVSPRTNSNQLLEALGGGMTVLPTRSDMTQGDVEFTGSDKDVAIEGEGYFAVRGKDGDSLTRDGRFLVDRDGFLVTGGQTPRKVLNDRKEPIRFESRARLDILDDGSIMQEGRAVNKLGLFNVANTNQLAKQGENLFRSSGPMVLKPSTALVRSGFVERANVDPATELTQLMEAQRAMEANANMIRTQDQMMARVVSDVGKIT